MEFVQQLASLGLVVWLVFTFARNSGGTGGLLLVVYWGLRIPLLAQQMASDVRDLTQRKNVVMRLLEPLSFASGQKTESGSARLKAEKNKAGMEIQLDNVSVIASGRAVLENVTLSIGGGQHIAVVGQSGAGKSSLVNLLLGIYRPSQGRVLVDGVAHRELDESVFFGKVAWVDPATHLWRTSVLQNVMFGNGDVDGLEAQLQAALSDAELLDVLKKLPEGLQSDVGEAGGRLSGGQGQRVRIARAFLKGTPRLVLLDEAFRGLDRSTRDRLLETARTRWQNATLLYVTHDIYQTKDFERVLVVENGRVCEDGKPSELLAKTGSRYLALMKQEEKAQKLWDGELWNVVRVEDGRLRQC